MIRPDNKANSIHFILGHITGTRYQIAQLLGEHAEFAHEALFDRGVAIKDAAEYPPFSQVKAAWDTISLRMPQVLETATEEQLSGPAPFDPPGMEKNVRGLLSFMAFHESYHIGQISYVRRLLGHAGPFG